MSNMPGQASDDFKGASSALRILYVGHRNSFAAELTTDGFTQTNPPVVDAAGTRSERLATTPKYGVLSGSVAFTRPDAGNGFVGGPVADTAAAGAVRPLGLFINDAAGNAYENTPGPASGKGPYVSSQGTMGSMLYETQQLVVATIGDALEYGAGDFLYASQNGYLTNLVGDAHVELDGGAAADATVLGVVKIAPDNAHAEVLFDLRV